MSEERIRRSSRIKQLPARFRDDDTRARPSSPNRITSNDTPSAQSQRTRRIPPEALSSSPLFLSSRKINTNKDDQIPHEGRAFTAQTDKPGQGASLNTGLVPGLSAGLSAGLIPGLSVDYISGLSAGSSTTESFTSHNTGQPIPTHLVTSPKMPASIPYLVVAQAYWEQNQQQWADPKRRKAMMLLPGVKEWNQKWVRNAEPYYRRFIVESKNLPDDFSDSEPETDKYRNGEVEPKTLPNGTNHPGPSFPMLRDLVPEVATMIYGKVSADCKVMWPKEWKSMVEKLFCMNAKDIGWIATVANKAVPSVVLPADELGHCKAFLGDRGFDIGKVLVAKCQDKSGRGSPKFIVSAQVSGI